MVNVKRYYSTACEKCGENIIRSWENATHAGRLHHCNGIVQVEENRKETFTKRHENCKKWKKRQDIFTKKGRKR